MDRRSICELRREFDERFGNQHREWVKVARISFQAKALGFEWDRTAAAKWVNDGGWPVWIAAPDFCPRFFENLFVGRRFPRNQPLDDVEQALTLSLLVRFSGERLGVRRRVVDQLREEHSAAGGERAACPPKMERARVATADALLSCCFLIDDVEREGDFDELGGHHASSGGVARCQ
jgi:hypothetical protein